MIYIKIISLNKILIKTNSIPLISRPINYTLTKIRPEAKIDNFAFKNSIIIIEGIIQTRAEILVGRRSGPDRVICLAPDQ